MGDSLSALASKAGNKKQLGPRTLKIILVLAAAQCVETKVIG